MLVQGCYLNRNVWEMFRHWTKKNGSIRGRLNQQSISRAGAVLLCFFINGLVSQFVGVAIAAAGDVLDFCLVKSIHQITNFFH